jgi:hypothetical protein
VFKIDKNYIFQFQDDNDTFFETNELDNLFSNWSNLIGGGNSASGGRSFSPAPDNEGTDDFFKPNVQEQCAQM